MWFIVVLSISFLALTALYVINRNKVKATNMSGQCQACGREMQVFANFLGDGGPYAECPDGHSGRTLEGQSFLGEDWRAEKARITAVIYSG